MMFKAICTVYLPQSAVRMQTKATVLPSQPLPERMGTRAQSAAVASLQTTCVVLFFGWFFFFQSLVAQEKSLFRQKLRATGQQRRALPRAAAVTRATMCDSPCGVAAHVPPCGLPGDRPRCIWGLFFGDPAELESILPLSCGTQLSVLLCLVSVLKLTLPALKQASDFVL